MNKKILIQILSLIFFFAPLAFVNAANLSIVPSNKTSNVGDVVTMSVILDAPSENVNAVSGVINFPTDKVQVTNISTTSSKVGFWIRQPSFSNSSGVINFEGVIMSPGFQGSSANVITITAKMVAPGTAVLDMISGSVLANDGLGTDVIGSFNGSTLTIAAFEVVPVEESVDVPVGGAIDDVPPAVSINSSTHPNSDFWYSGSDPRFTWNFANDVTTIKTLVSAKSDSVPTITYSPIIEEKDVFDMPDGSWYFHLRGRNENGWGPISHFNFNIDSVTPEYIEITRIENTDETDPTIRFKLDSYDETSGIDHYAIYIDGEFVEDIDGDSEKYESPTIAPGDHTIEISAVDAAGNSISATEQFSILALERPEITSYPTEAFIPGDMFEITGTSNYPGGEVLLSITRDGSNDISVHTVQVDQDGNFAFIYDQITEAGHYIFSVIAIDGRGAQSTSTEEYYFICSEPFITLGGQKIINVLVIIISILALIFLILFLVSWARYRLAILKKRRNRHNKRPDHLLHEELELLQTNLESHLALLDRIHRGTKLSPKDLRIVSSVMTQLKKMEISIQKSTTTTDYYREFEKSKEKPKPKTRKVSVKKTPVKKK